MKLTGWYSGNQKPLPDRIGDFERDYSSLTKTLGHNISKCHWDGERFRARYMKKVVSVHQSLPWRGVER